MSIESADLRDAAQALLDTFLARVDGARGPAEVEDIHQARTASRRLQALLTLAYPSDPKVAQTCRMLRRYRRALGACRDADVTLGHIEGFTESAAERRGRALGLLSAHLQRQRHKALDSARHALRRIDTPDERRSMRAALRDIQDAAADSGPRVADLLKLRSDRLAVALLCAAQSGDAGDLHAARIAGKKLRYVAEWAPHLGVHPDPEAIARLKKMQDELGLWHDLLTLEARILDFCASRRRLSRTPHEIAELLLWMNELRESMAAIAADCLAAHAPSESGTRISAAFQGDRGNAQGT